MNILKRNQTLIPVIALAAVFAVLGSTNVYAQKKPGGGGTVPAGTIYFEQGPYPYTARSMKGDGSSKTDSVSGQPTYQLHGGASWFLTTMATEGTDPDGTSHAELFVATEGGLPLQVTNDPNVEPTDIHRWAKNDSFMSFTAVITSPEGDSAGLFVADVDWSLGVPVVGTPQKVLEANLFYGIYPSISSHDWSPFGDEVVYTHSAGDGSNPSLKVTKFFADGTTQTRSLGEGAGPVWSPDGARIAFSIIDIWSILPDGTGALQLTKTKSYDIWNELPQWSPDSQHLVFLETTRKWKRGDLWYTYYRDILRITASGGGKTNLTSDTDEFVVPLAWR
jgi:hypothetical protein